MTKEGGADDEKEEEEEEEEEDARRQTDLSTAGGRNGSGGGGARCRCHARASRRVNPPHRAMFRGAGRGTVVRGVDCDNEKTKHLFFVGKMNVRVVIQFSCHPHLKKLPFAGHLFIGFRRLKGEMGLLLEYHMLSKLVHHPCVELGPRRRVARMG